MLIQPDDMATIVQPQIPKEIDEIIRQYGTIIETYKHIVEVWSHPPMFVSSGNPKKEEK